MFSAASGTRALTSYSIACWNFAAEGFEETEELFHLAKDPSELTNAAENPEYATKLAEMRTTYDQAVDHWKKNAVPYHRYQEFGTIFDRSVKWDAKAKLMNKKR